MRRWRETDAKALRYPTEAYRPLFAALDRVDDFQDRKLAIDVMNRFRETRGIATPVPRGERNTERDRDGTQR